MTMKKNSVFVATFSGEERDGWPCPGLSLFMGELGVMRARGERNIQRLGLANARPHDYARNAAAKAFRESGLDWLLMIDNDMVPPPHLLEMLDFAAPEMGIIVPRFFCLTDQTPNHMNLALSWGLRPGEKIPQNVSWVELEWAGSGVMAIRKSVFHALKRPYFKFGYDENGFMVEGEDRHFCQKARDAGFRIFGNTAFEADHFHTISLSTLARIVECAKPGPAPPPSTRRR
jgi:GT2 family glycosyltransferase